MTDLCQTPGCGHARYDHFRTTSRCGESSCPCTGYTAPTETGQGDNDGCWHDWKPSLLQASHVIVCAECGKYWDTAEQTREQVLADAEAAWETWLNRPYIETVGNDDEHANFVAGYLAGKGIAE